MNFDQIFFNGLIISGVFILCYSLYPATRILAEMPTGGIRRRWWGLRALILVFIMGYLVYIAFTMQERHLEDLVVALIFFFGALFVLAVCILTLTTVKDLKQLDILQTENITDELTGMYNRRHLERCLEKEISRAQNYNIPVSMLMLDLDHYKKINDLHGHQVGDQVLICIGNLLKQATRRMDIVARYGGDEITILLPNTDKDTAWSIANRVRSLVENKSPAFQDEFCKCKDVCCTVSVGAATLTGDKIKSEQLLQMADAALYQAKQSGRNCVVMHKVNMQTTPGDD